MSILWTYLEMQVIIIGVSVWKTKSACKQIRFSAMPGPFSGFLSWTNTKQRIKRLAQWCNTVPPVSLELATLRSQSLEEGKYQESIQSNTTPDPGHHMGEWQNSRKHHIQESQYVNTFSAGDHKAARNRQDSMTEKNEPQITKMIHKKHRSKKIIGGLKHKSLGQNRHRFWGPIRGRAIKEESKVANRHWFKQYFIQIICM